MTELCAPTSPLGRVRAIRSVGPFSFWESHQPPGLEVGEHQHGQASLCLVLEGGYFETSDGDSWIGAGSVVLAPPGDGGRLRFGPRGARTLLVEGPEDGWCELFGLDRVPETPDLRSDGSGLGLALAAHLGAPGATLSDLLVDLGAAWMQSRRVEAPAPRYLSRALALMEEGLGEPWSLSAVAKEVGVHRISLARAFRRHLRTTVGQHLRELRLGQAARLIARGHRPAEVAAQFGFADQSHLTRLFRRRFGAPPARFRRGLSAGSWATEVQDNGVSDP